MKTALFTAPVWMLGLIGLGVGCGDTEPPAAAPSASVTAEAPAAAPAPATTADEAAPVAATAPGDAPPPPQPATPSAVVPGPEDGATGPELGDRPGRIPADGELPTFDQGTVKVTIKLPRKMSGQVDFIAKDAQAPQGFRVVHAQRFTDSDTIHVNAPAGYSESLYVLVHEFPDGIPVYGPEVPKGVVAEPVTFDTPGAEYDVLWNEGVAWMAEVFQPGEGDPVPSSSSGKDAGAKP